MLEAITKNANSCIQCLLDDLDDMEPMPKRKRLIGKTPVKKRKIELKQKKDFIIDEAQGKMLLFTVFVF